MEVENGVWDRKSNAGRCSFGPTMPELAGSLRVLYAEKESGHSTGV